MKALKEKLVFPELSSVSVFPRDVVFDSARRLIKQETLFVKIRTRSSSSRSQGELKEKCVHLMR